MPREANLCQRPRRHTSPGPSTSPQRCCASLGRGGIAALCASVVRLWRTIRRSLRAKCFSPRTRRGEKRFHFISRLRARNSCGGLFYTLPAPETHASGAGQGFLNRGSAPGSCPPCPQCPGRCRCRYTAICGSCSTYPAGCGCCTGRTRSRTRSGG